MKRFFTVLTSLILLQSALYAQSIETPANIPLSVSGDLNLTNSKTIQVGGNQFIKLPAASSSNTFIGLSAGAANTTGDQNTFLGFQAGFSNNGTANLFIGSKAGYKNTTGQFNSFIGVQAGMNNTSGNSNFMFGTNAGASNTTGTANYFLGDNTGGSNSTGGFNIYIGTNAGNGPGVNGDNNVALGFEAGRANSGGVTNLFLGFRADAGANGLINSTAIGPNAKVNVSNALVLGNGANVGIGTSAPSTKLHIVNAEANTSGVRLQNLTSASPATALNQSKFLTVDNNGNVILGSTTSSARIGSESHWQVVGNHLQNANTGGVIIGTGVSQTPTGYGLYVGQGILAEKVKVAIHNSAEWSDRVFDTTYRLRSLGEVESYIKSYKHLPGVPSAETVVKEGVDVGKMDAKLLEKVEELTLYIIEQNKNIKALQRQNQHLNERLLKLEKRH